MWSKSAELRVRFNQMFKKKIESLVYRIHTDRMNSCVKQSRNAFHNQLYVMVVMIAAMVATNRA